MNFSDELLFFFSALGVFNATLISIFFFFFKRPRDISNYFFGFLLLMLAIRVGKSVVFYFYEDLSDNYIKIGLAALILIGPSLYFYIVSVITPTKISKLWPMHFLLLLASQIIVGVHFTETFNPIFYRIYWLDIIYWIWLGYLIAAALVMKRHGILRFNNLKKIDSQDFWLLSVWLGNTVLWIAYKVCHFISYISGALSFSFVLYLLILVMFFRMKKRAVFSNKPKYANKKINSSAAANLLSQLEKLMTSEKLYKNANLKLPEVAKKLNIIPHTLSQLLNDNLDKNFTSFINEYRVKEAKEMILLEDSLTLEAIGYACGFNSKTTFYAAFRKFTNTTPAQFRKNK